jgi:hypothetical protein
VYATRKLKCWIALVVLAALAFAQASIAIAGCELDRRAFLQIAISGTAEDRECDMQLIGQAPISSNRCAAHCTADLQISGMAAAIVREVGESSVLRLPPSTVRLSIGPSADAAPNAPIPIRILLHSFLI